MAQGEPQTIPQASGWPATTAESLPWERDGAVVGSRRDLRASAGPYQAAVPPPIAALSVNLPADLAALAEDAGRELTRFDAEVGTLAAPFSSILLRSESASSSEVENLTSSAKQLALAEIGDSTSVNAQLVLGNVSAMRAAVAMSEDLSTEAILTMHRELLERSAPDAVGRWRTEQVWIGGGRVSPHRASFVPPHQGRVPELMADLVEFARRTDVTALAQVAIAHAQFETIHPFPDGNGRTGRALIQGMLRAAGVTKNVTVPVSAGLLSNNSRYFEALTAYREGDVRPIIETVSEAAFAAITNGRVLEQEITAIAARWEEQVRARRDSSVHAVKSLLLRQPVVTVAVVARETGVTEPAANAAIQKLVQAGVLTQSTAGRRNRHWQASEVLSALDGFGRRSRRERP